MKPSGLRALVLRSGNNRQSVRCFRVASLALALLPLCLPGQNPGPNPVWSDEFNLPVGSAPDPTKWTYDLGGGGWGNDELETYTSSTANASVVNDPAATDGKALAITAINGASGYTSARIKTQGLFSVTYGMIEARARVPVGTGLWPAFWMLGNNFPIVGWPQCGEIDIMENLGSDSTKIYGTLHGPGYSGADGISSTYVLPNGGTFSAAYHIFAVQWSPNQIQWSVDGNVYQTLTPSSIPPGTQWVYNNAPFFIIMNLAVGGTFPGNPTASTVFPQSYLIDYVRVYDLAPSPPATFAAYATVTGTVGLSWTAPTATGGNAVTGYQLVRATDSGFTQNVTTFNLGTPTSYVDSTVTVGTTYYYHVSAVTSGGVSLPGVTVSVQPAVSTGQGGPSSQFVNLSTRCFIGTGANIGVAGLVIRGGSPETILLRGAGPALGAIGLGGYLPDPQINLYDVNGNLLATNAGWGNNANASAISAAAASAGAFAFAAGSADSALLVTLAPGAYTAQVSGESGDAGVALIEAYEVSP